MIPLEGCLSQSVVMHSRTLDICDVRIVAAIGEHHDERYRRGKEPALCAIRNELHLTKRKLSAAAPVLFGCSPSRSTFSSRSTHRSTSSWRVWQHLPRSRRQWSDQQHPWSSPSQTAAADLGAASAARIQPPKTRSWISGHTSRMTNNTFRLAGIWLRQEVQSSIRSSTRTPSRRARRA
jgi:hypothetical protein